MIAGRRNKRSKAADEMLGVLKAKSLSEKNKPMGITLLERIEMSDKRFILVDAEIIGERMDNRTEYWLDLNRAIKEAPGFIGVQVYKGKDPNNFIKITGMRILFNDQAEYYFVCQACFYAFKDMQFSGGTKGSPGWRDRAQRYLEAHEKDKSYCEFCDPIFGNGGWSR